MAEYTLSPLAKQDLRLIGKFTQERWGIEQRNRYIDEIVDAFKALAYDRMLGRLREDIRAATLCYLYKSHVIYFRRIPNGDVEILRILHQRMDTKVHLQNPR